MPLAGGKPPPVPAGQGMAGGAEDGGGGSMGLGYSGVGSESGAGGIRGKEGDDDSDDDDDEPAGGMKFGEPLTRTVAADGFASRGNFDDDGVSLVGYGRVVEETCGLF
jgi:hypothetical protein